MLRLTVVLVLSIGIDSADALRNRSRTATDRSGDKADPSISWFLKYTPFFDLTKIPQISAKCRRDFGTFLSAMDNLELWALKSEKRSNVER